jgi:hypothetical protein
MRHRSLPACTFFAVADIEKITIKTYFFSSLLGLFGWFHVLELNEEQKVIDDLECPTDNKRPTSKR